MLAIGIDNGVTGAIAFLQGAAAELYPMSTVQRLSYTKKKQYVNLVDANKLTAILVEKIAEARKADISLFAYIERPMVNPKMFRSSLSAVMAFWDVVRILGNLGIGYRVTDSKQWQRRYLPAGCKGAELKKASAEREQNDYYATSPEAIRLLLKMDRKKRGSEK